MPDTKEQLATKEAKKLAARKRKQDQVKRDKKLGLMTFRQNRVSQKVYDLLTAYYETIREDK